MSLLIKSFWHQFSLSLREKCGEHFFAQRIWEEFFWLIRAMCARKHCKYQYFAIKNFDQNFYTCGNKFQLSNFLNNIFFQVTNRTNFHERHGSMYSYNLLPGFNGLPVIDVMNAVCLAMFYRKINFLNDTARLFKEHYASEWIVFRNKISVRQKISRTKHIINAVIDKILTKTIICQQSKLFVLIDFKAGIIN